MSQYFLKLAFSDDASTFFSKMVRKVTGGPGHALVEVLEITDAGHREHYYFESVWRTDEVSHKDGVRGPLPLTKLVKWVNEKRPERSLVEVPAIGYLPLTPEEATRAVARMRDAVHTIRYARKQLLRNWVASFGLRIGFGSGSPLAMTCCEMPLRCGVIPSRFWDLIDMRDVNADEVVPGGCTRFSLMAAAHRIVERYGIIMDAV